MKKLFLQTLLAFFTLTVFAQPYKVELNKDTVVRMWDSYDAGLVNYYGFFKRDIVANLNVLDKVKTYFPILCSTNNKDSVLHRISCEAGSEMFQIRNGVKYEDLDFLEVRKYFRDSLYNLPIQIRETKELEVGDTYIVRTKYKYGDWYYYFAFKVVKTNKIACKQTDISRASYADIQYKFIEVHKVNDDKYYLNKVYVVANTDTVTKPIVKDTNTVVVDTTKPIVKTTNTTDLKESELDVYETYYTINGIKTSKEYLKKDEIYISISSLGEVKKIVLK